MQSVRNTQDDLLIITRASNQESKLTDNMRIGMKCA